MINQNNLTDQEWLQQWLAQKHLAPNKRAGQNFLICGEVVEATLAMLAEGPKRITELGSGLGTLTWPLLNQGYEVKALEIDRQLVAMMKETIPSKLTSKLKIVQADLREADWSQPEPYQLVGNIPYNLSGLISRKLTQLEPAPEQAVFLVQQEVGERWCAQPPAMHLSTVAIRLWGEAQVILTVPANCFWPAPKVTSQLVGLWPRKNNPYNRQEREEAIGLAKMFFQQRRKQVGGVLLKRRPRSAAENQQILSAAGIKPTNRPQEVAAEQWINLNKLLKK